MVKFAKKNRFCLLDVFKLIARTSKYDFWIPGKILGWSSKKYFEKTYFFEMNNVSEENRKIFFETQKISKKNIS